MKVCNLLGAAATFQAARPATQLLRLDGMARSITAATGRRRKFETSHTDLGLMMVRAVVLLNYYRLTYIVR
jgi:hypothetical protein